MRPAPQPTQGSPLSARGVARRPARCHCRSLQVQLQAGRRRSALHRAHSPSRRQLRRLAAATRPPRTALFAATALPPPSLALQLPYRGAHGPGADRCNRPQRPRRRLLPTDGCGGQQRWLRPHRHALAGGRAPQILGKGELQAAVGSLLPIINRLCTACCSRSGAAGAATAGGRWRRRPFSSRPSSRHVQGILPQQHPQPLPAQPEPCIFPCCRPAQRGRCKAVPCREATWGVRCAARLKRV